MVNYGGWIAVKGLPLHWWSKPFFKQVGAACGRLFEVHMLTKNFIYLLEAKIRVRSNRSSLIPQAVKVSVTVTIVPLSSAIKPMVPGDVEWSGVHDEGWLTIVRLN